MHTFKPSKLALALLSTGVMAITFPVVSLGAEEQQQEQEELVVKKVEKIETNEKEESETVITVTGFRSALNKSLARKKSETSIVESLSAEDIGKLPDTSIAESLARLPGLAAQRLDGRANVISIRGVGPEFNVTTLNGREQVTIGDSRSVEFDQYPSEIINEVVVYKTPDASVATTQGLGGNIDLRTIRPLETSERIFKVNGRLEKNSLGNLNPDVDDMGERFNVTYVDKFVDDSLGFAFSVTHMNSPNQEERWNAWGYPQIGTDGGTPYTDAQGNDIDPSTLVLGGAKPYVRSSELKRTSAMGVIEFAPNDTYRTTFDAFYSDFEDKQILRGIETPVWWGVGNFNSSVTPLVVEDGLVTQGQINNAFLQVRNDVNIRDAELQAYGWNNVFTINDRWEVTADLSYSKADRADFGLETYAGTGRGNFVGIGDTIGFTMNGTRGATFTPSLDYSDPNIFMLGGNLSWGNGNTVPSDGQDGFINNPWVQDELTALRLSAETELDNEIFSGYEFGVNISERTKFKRDSGSFLTLNTYPALSPVPAQFQLSPVSLDFLGFGNMLTYDALGLYRSGIYNQISENATVSSRATASWDNKEEVTTAYFKLDIDTDLSDIPVRGNVGFQVVSTDQSSVGNAVRPETDPVTGIETGSGLLEVYRATGGDSYTEFLPSLNLSFEVADDQFVRLGLARVMARAEMSQMNASRSFSFDVTRIAATDADFQADPESSPWRANGGNPELRPTILNQLDISYEHYFNEGYFALAAYHKHLENWVNTGASVIGDFSAIDAPGVPDTTTRFGLIQAPENGAGGSITGAELSLYLPWSMFSDTLDGFGSIVSYSYNDNEVRERNDSDPIKLDGLSREVANATVFYENNGWQLRTSARYRSDFQGEVTGLSLTRTTVTVQSETVVDAQISYDFAESGNSDLAGLSVFLQATNLTDEPFVTYNNNDRRQIRDYQVYGRNYMLGFGYNF